MKSILALSFLVMCLVGVAVSQTTTCDCTCNGVRQRPVVTTQRNCCTCICGGPQQDPLGVLGWNESMGEKGYPGPRGFPGAPGPNTYSESAGPGSGLPASMSSYSHSSHIRSENDAATSNDDHFQ